MRAKFILIPVLALFTWSTFLSAQEAKPVQQILNIHSEADPETLDPALNHDIYGANVEINLFEGLVRNNPKTLDAEPGAAEKATLSKDGKTYTFKIKKNLIL